MSDRKMLEQEQERNCRFLEAWGKEALPKMNGVPLLLGLNYELLQLLNMTTIQALGMCDIEKAEDKAE